MPVYLNGDFSSHELFSDAKWTSRERQTRCIDVGLINNMPDGALQATERQFANLLNAAAGDLVVRLSLYSLPEVPRTEMGRNHIRRFYSDLDSLWDRPVDGLIVTGTEPVASRLNDEPYWNALTKVIEWAEENTHSTIWSCLAAHAAVLHIDGIERRRLDEKRFGLFECIRAADHPLTSGTPPLFMMPHSRWNELSRSELSGRGYELLALTPDGWVDSFIKQRKSLFVFFQGHPEYEARTLSLEYRRDVGRYLRGERDTYPKMPHAYFDQEAQKGLTAAQMRACADRQEELFASFPIGQVEKKLDSIWQYSAAQIYRNWLMHLSSQNKQLLRQATASRTDRCVENNCATPFC